MTGTIRKRAEKCYQIRVSMGFDPKTGKRRRQEKTVHGTRKEAERYMREFVQSYETGRVVQSSDQALKDYLLYWIDSAKAGKLAERTLYDYRNLVSLHFSGKIGKKALSHLRPLDIQDFYQTLAEYSLSQRRQVHHMRQGLVLSGLPSCLSFVSHNQPSQVVFGRSRVTEVDTRVWKYSPRTALKTGEGVLFLGSRKRSESFHGGSKPALAVAGHPSWVSGRKVALDYTIRHRASAFSLIWGQAFEYSLPC